MTLVLRYKQGLLVKDFYMDYRISHIDNLNFIYPQWKKKFEELGFWVLEENTFCEMFKSLIENNHYLSKPFSVELLSMDK